MTIPGFYTQYGSGARGTRLHGENWPERCQILRDAGVEKAGASGIHALRADDDRPALTINGIRGGYQGPGSKAVIPARAAGKAQFSTGPGPGPGRHRPALSRQYIARITPPPCAPDPYISSAPSPP